NLARHIGIVREFGINPVVAVNRFPTDTEADIELIRALALEAGAYAAEVNDAFEQGGAGASALAEAVVAAADQPSSVDFLYRLAAPIDEMSDAIPPRRPVRSEVRRDRQAGLRSRRHLPPQGCPGQDRSVQQGGPRPAPDLHG